MKNIREVTRKIAKARGLTLSGLTEKLGYRSKTSLERIMNGTTRESSLVKFEQAMHEALILSEEERAALHEAVLVSRCGEETYRVRLKMWEFVQGSRLANSPALTVRDVQDGKPIDLAARYRGQRVRALVFNCQYIGGLFSLLRELLGVEGACVRHFMYLDSDGVRAMSAINALMSVFYLKGYSGYTFTVDDSEKGMHCGINTLDGALFDYQDEQGVSCEDIVIFNSTDSGRLMTLRGAHGRTENLLGIDTRSFQSIKHAYFHCGAFEDYVRYSREYAMLEFNRGIWKIKPDIGIDQIPPHILASAFLRSPESENKDPRFLDSFAALREIYDKRFENTYSKRKHAYTIMKRGAMLRFAQTGRTSDHFWMMDAYTPEERMEILQSLLRQQMENPYLHMFFLKQDDVLRDVEIACYEDFGMLLLEADTGYNLDEGHSEALITHQVLLQLYRDFFMNVLLRDYVLPKSETIRFLRQLIAEVMQAIQAARSGGSRSVPEAE